MTDSSETTLDNTPHNPDISSTSPPLPAKSTFTNGWQEAGFVLAIMLGQSFNLTPFGAVSDLRCVS
jgi:hypothetical protein